MKLLAILLAFALLHWVEKPKVLKSHDWIDRLHLWLQEQNGNLQQVMIMAVALPVFLLWIGFSLILDIPQASLFYLLIHVLVIYYCLGPDGVKQMLDKPVTESKATESSPEQRVYQLTDAALHRWFGVFFWYVVLNIYGALLYRVVCHLKHAGFEKDQPLIDQFLKVMEFPVVVLMTISLALASDFDRIWKHCKQYLNGETIRTLNSQFMYKSMDYAVEQCEIDSQDDDSADVIGLTTYTVLRRMLVVWLVFAALLVIFSIG